MADNLEVSVSDPMNRGAVAHGSFAKAVHAVAAHPLRDNDRVTIGYLVTATKTRKEWRDVYAKLKDKPESMAAWLDRESAEAAEAASN